MASSPGDDETAVSEHLLRDRESSPPANDNSQQETKVNKPHPTKDNTVRFWPQLYVPIAVLVYTGLLLSEWSIVCLLSRNGIVAIPKITEYEYVVGKARSRFDTFVQAHGRWWRAARILQSITGVATLPLTSAVCAFAAVAFVQSQRSRKASLTLRQTLNIADRGWTSPDVLFPMLWSPRKYGSSFLWVAILLHIAGALINPLQELLLGQTSDKVVLPDQQIASVVKDIPALTDKQTLRYVDSGASVTMLRSLLSTARSSDSYQTLWGGNVTCNCLGDFCSPLDVFKCQPASTNATYKVTANYVPPKQELFLSPVVANTSTGLVRQFAPRMNSTLRWDVLGPDSFPRDCSGSTFFRNYTTGPDVEKIIANSYSVSVCMPGNLSHSPFENTRDRQDFDETLFVTASYGRYDKTYKLTLSTTMGYFELPNDIRGGKFGPLLEKNPFPNCTSPQCHNQTNPGISLPGSAGYSEVSPNGYSHGQFFLDYVPSKGPLALITLALFSKDSFLDPGTHNLANIRNSTKALNYMCYEYVPLAFLFGIKPCTTEGPYVQTASDWLSAFTSPNSAIPALNQAAFLAHQVIFQQPDRTDASDDDTTTPSLDVFFRGSLKYDKPAISSQALIGLSVLIGVYLLMLIFLCLVTLTQVSWAASLNSHAIMKISAGLCASSAYASGEKSTEEKEDILDVLPGHIGDAEPDALVGRLAVGAEAPLRWKRRYWKGEGLAL